MKHDRSATAMIWVVFLHLVATFVHGAAHIGAAVSLSPAAMGFVVLVIQLGPVAGLFLTRVAPMAGTLVVGATMAAALLFGFVNHFVISGADHVSHVAAPWQALFGSTAALLVVCEASGVAISAWRAMGAFRKATL